MRQKKLRQKRKSPKEIVGLLRLPHLDQGGNWRVSSGYSPFSKTEMPGYDRLLYYAGFLLEAGVPDWEIGGMFADLYWDAFAEFRHARKIHRCG